MYKPIKLTKFFIIVVNLKDLWKIFQHEFQKKMYFFGKNAICSLTNFTLLNSNKNISSFKLLHQNRLIT